MELDERKIKILNAIIQTYLETGEPVGSRTISRFTDLKLSSATIRNEMSDLEEMGYILQPHTSAGRIPSDKGYRFYVDNLMKVKSEEVVRQNEMMVQKVDKLEQVLKQVGSQAISYTTGVPAMIGAALVLDKVWDKDGVFNIEEFDPDPFMDMLNQYGLPWVVDENPQTVE